MNVFYKQPSEIEQISVDFTDILALGEIISSMTAVATDDTGTIVTTTTIHSSVVVSPICYVTVKAGITGQTYKITIKATSNLGNLYEEDVIMKVIET